MSLRETKFCVIHCADTPASMDIGSAEIDEWHRARGWSAIGYHFVIRRNGGIEKGRDLDNDGDVFDEVGAHVKGYNKNSIGICLVGGKGGFNFTKKQMHTLDFLMMEIEAKYPDIEFLGHCDMPGVDKTCPNFNVTAWRS